MKIFKLPDLGEGLPDAIIREWYVQPGEFLEHDQLMVAMETAKALVDVPAPFSGKVEKLFGAPGDTIDTDSPLIGFEGEPDPVRDQDLGTVVGRLETATLHTAADTGVKTTPAVRMLAKQLGVDLAHIAIPGQIIKAEDVKKAAGLFLSGELIPLSGPRRAMAISMTTARREVVAATIMDEAHLDQWADKQDITLRLIRAITDACQAVPQLNSYYDGQRMAYQLNAHVNIGIAVDTEYGLYVPVLKNALHCSDQSIRETINRFKQQALDRCIAPEDLRDATILMSNIGAMAGQYATPIVIPPMVAIVAAGRIKGKTHRTLPLSVAFDHRPVTGGDAARFLRAMISSLEKPLC